MRLANVFDNPSREKALSAVVKRTCSGVRNSLRQDVCLNVLNNLVSSNKVSLDSGQHMWQLTCYIGHIHLPDSQQV